MIVVTKNQITNGNYRPCLVDGKKALFHQWIKKGMLLIESNRFKDKTEFYNVCMDSLSSWDPHDKVTTYTETRALVEFEDGTVNEVDPCLVKFVDSEELFEEYTAFRKRDLGVRLKCPHCDVSFIFSRYGSKWDELASTGKYVTECKSCKNSFTIRTKHTMMGEDVFYTESGYLATKGLNK